MRCIDSYASTASALFPPRTRPTDRPSPELSDVPEALLEITYKLRRLRPVSSLHTETSLRQVAASARVMQTPRIALYIDENTFLPRPSALPTQALPFGPKPSINHSVHRPSTNSAQASRLSHIASGTAVAEKASKARSPEQEKVQFQRQLLPRASNGLNPIIVTSSGTGRTVEALLKRNKVKRTTHFRSKQAQILADLLGGTGATW